MGGNAYRKKINENLEIERLKLKGKTPTTEKKSQDSKRRQEQMLNTKEVREKVRLTTLPGEKKTREAAEKALLDLELKKKRLREKKTTRKEAEKARLETERVRLETEKARLE